MGEFGAASSSFKAMGYIPEGRIHYNCGFNANGVRAAADLSTDNTNIGVHDTVTAVGTAGFAPTASNGTTDYSATALTGLTDSALATPNFTVSCHGQIGSSNNTEDRWTMDQAKLLRMLQDGTS